MLFTIFLLFVSAKLEDICLALVPFLIKSILEIIKVTLVELDLTIKKNGEINDRELQFARRPEECSLIMMLTDTARVKFNFSMI